MKTVPILAACLLLAGCATALKHESQCLASLTPEYLQALEELDQLEASWLASSSRRNADLNGPRSALPPPAVSEAEEAYRRLIETRSAHRPLLEWYEKVYTRVRTRMDEDEILTRVQMVLITNPGVMFYPLIRWNVHNVFWDGADPDAESDPVTRYCQDRLNQVVASAPAESTALE